jgi:hypothetical protein
VSKHHHGAHGATATRFENSEKIEFGSDSEAKYGCRMKSNHEDFYGDGDFDSYTLIHLYVYMCIYIYIYVCVYTDIYI